MNFVRRTWHRRSRKGCKYKFLVSPNELAIDLTNAEKAEQRIIVAFMHRKRRYECMARTTEESFSDPNRRLIQWPNATSNSIQFNITLFRDDDKEAAFDDKEWTVVVESLDAKDRTRPLAAIALNLPLFAGKSLEVKLKLRPLQPEVHRCVLTLTLISSLLKGIACLSSEENSVASANQIICETDASKSVYPLKSIDDIESTQEIFKLVDTPKSKKAENSRNFIKADELIKSKEKVFVKREDLAKKFNGTSNADANSAGLSPPSLILTSFDSDGKNEEKIQASTSTDVDQNDAKPKKTLVSPDIVPASISKVMEELEFLTQRKADDMERIQKEQDEEETIQQLEEERQRKLREEARRLMRDALETTNAQRSFMFRSTHARASTSSPVAQDANGIVPSAALRSSQTDLRTLDESPVLASLGISKPLANVGADDAKISSSMATATNGGSSSATDATLSAASASALAAVTSISIDGVVNQRHGESIDDEEEDNDYESGRKLTTRFENELRNPASKIQSDLDEIAERIAEVERFDAYVKQKMENTEIDSDEERKYIEQHFRYLTERASLVRQQDYLNVLIDLKETTAKIENLQQLINQITTDELLHTNKTETLMTELKNLIDKKDQLSHTLIDKETEDEEEKERSRLVMQQPFQRGIVQPQSASRRLLNWLSSPRNNAAAN